MAALVLSVLFLLFSISVTDATWCVCRSDQSTPALQKTIDYACGAGADCTPILENGACYNPDTVIAHCSYATNSYFQRKGQAQGACDFTGTATVSTTDPSYPGCTYPASVSAAGTSTAPTATTPTSTTPTSTTPTTTPTTFTPTGATPTGGTTGGTTGGILGGLGPTGTTSIDSSGGDVGSLPNLHFASFSLAFALSLTFAFL